MTRTTHPTLRQVLDHVDGTTGPRRGADVESHVDGGCVPCAQLRDAVTSIQDLLADGPLPRPPSAVIRSAQRLFVRRRIQSAVSAVQRIVAVLVLDQRADLVPALRSAPGETRRLLWTAGEHELYVALTATATGWDLEGEVLPPDASDIPPAGSLTLLRDGREVDRARLGETARFGFGSLPRGTYELAAEIDGAAVRVPAFVVD